MITTEKITLRPWTLDDIPSFAKYANNLNVSRFLTDRFPFPYTEADAKGFIEMATSDPQKFIFCIEKNNEAIGGIGLHPQIDIRRKNAMLAYWLAEPYWGRGIMTEAIEKIVAFGFETMDIHRIYAQVFHTNIASQRVLEKSGFTLEAKFEKAIIKNNELLDEWIYAIRRP